MKRRNGYLEGSFALVVDMFWTVQGISDKVQTKVGMYAVLQDIGQNGTDLKIRTPQAIWGVRGGREWTSNRSFDRYTYRNVLRLFGSAFEYCERSNTLTNERRPVRVRNTHLWVFDEFNMKYDQRLDRFYVLYVVLAIPDNEPI